MEVEGAVEPLLVLSLVHQGAGAGAEDQRPLAAQLRALPLPLPPHRDEARAVRVDRLDVVRVLEQDLGHPQLLDLFGGEDVEGFILEVEELDFVVEPLKDQVELELDKHVCAVWGDKIKIPTIEIIVLPVDQVKPPK